MEAAEQTSNFIDFPPKDEILRRLRSVDDSAEGLEKLYDSIGDRLAARTYERSASAFILIEIIYDFEENNGGDLSYLLPRYILSLTNDRDLALSALSAFNEIKDAIRIQAPPKPTPKAAPEPVPEMTTEPMPETQPEPSPPPLVPDEPTEADVMMGKLQNSQKALVDLGLSTRVSIDMVMRRPSRDRVSRTLQDISALRTALRRFEELLSEAEVQVLEAAGVLWEGGEEEQIEGDES